MIEVEVGEETTLRPPTYRPYIVWGRHQLRIGWIKRRHDRWCDEFHFIGFEWHL